MSHKKKLLHLKPDVRRRTLILILFILSIFSVLYLKIALDLKEEQRELRETKFLYIACNAKLETLKVNTTVQPEDFKSKWTLTWPSHYLKSSRFRNILIALNGTKTVTGLYGLKALNSSNFVLPHLRTGEGGLLPAFQMSGGRYLVDVVVGVTTVRRDKANYLIDSLTGLIEGLSETEKSNTLIVVMVGEVDMDYVLNTARNIELKFEKEVKSGLIEVISPSKSYYPTDEIPATLGDSVKRTLWRAKHILDCVYTMAYGHRRGSSYVIMEDDIAAKKGYMTQMKQVIGFTSRYKPKWLILEFSQGFNGFGKLLRSSDIDHFAKYLQLFYYNKPLDFLIESYLQDKACVKHRQINHKNFQLQLTLKGKQLVLA